MLGFEKPVVVQSMVIFKVRMTVWLVICSCMHNNFYTFMVILSDGKHKESIQTHSKIL